MSASVEYVERWCGNPEDLYKLTRRRWLSTGAAFRLLGARTEDTRFQTGRVDSGGLMVGRSRL